MSVEQTILDALVAELNDQPIYFHEESGTVDGMVDLGAVVKAVAQKLRDVYGIGAA